MLLAHSVIPHQHHDERYAQHQSAHDDDDHNDIDHNFLGEAFSHFQHEQGGTIVYETASPEYQNSKVNIDKDTVLLVQYFVQAIFKPPLKHSYFPSVHFTSAAYSLKRLLRGPPAYMA